MDLKIKKTGALLLAAALAAGAAFSLTGCGADNKVSGTSGAPPSDGKGQSTAEQTDDNGSKIKLKALNIDIAYGYESDWNEDENNNTTVSCSFPSRAAVTNEGFEKLQEGLNKVFSDKTTYHMTAMQNILDADDGNSQPHGYVRSIDTLCEVKRSDSALVSMMFEETQELSKDHADVYRSCANIDGKSGKVLKTSDIIIDSKKFQDAALKALDTLAQERGFDDDYSEQLERVFGTDYDDLTIYTDTRNLYVYFPTYTFGVYSAGDAELAIPLYDCRKFMKAEYIYPSSADIVKITPSDDQKPLSELDPDNDPARHREYSYVDGQVNFSLRTDENEFEMTGTMSITSDGKTITEEMLDWTVRDVYIVKTDNGGAYAYVEIAYLGSGQCMKVYDIDGEPTLKGSVDAAFCGHCSTMPNDMTLYSTIDKLGTYSGYKTYHADKDSGVPVTDDDEYQFINLYNPEGYAYTVRSTVPLKLDFDGKEETFPAGTEFHGAASDNYSYVKFELDDGRIGKLYTYDNNLIKDASGKYLEEFECFEELPYAG